MVQLGVVMNRARHILPFKANAQYLTPAILFTGLLVIRLPGDLSPEGQRVLAVMGMAVDLWITQAFPLAVSENYRNCLEPMEADSMVRQLRPAQAH